MNENTTVLCCCLYLSWRHVSAFAPGHLQVTRYIIEEIIYSVNNKIGNVYLKFNETSLNFIYIYIIYISYFCDSHNFIYDSHRIVSSIIYIYIYILWPEDGPVRRPKHVVSLNKDNNIRQLCFDSKEPIFNWQKFILIRKVRHPAGDHPSCSLVHSCIYPPQILFSQLH